MMLVALALSPAAARLGQARAKLLRAALANATEQLHHLVARHADARVWNRQRALVKVARQRNVHRSPRIGAVCRRARPAIRDDASPSLSLALEISSRRKISFSK
jgi:hypothetical protein